jgi:hypothetical protein
VLKSELIRQAYAMIRISGLTSTQVPEETAIALQELDQMMSQWAAMGRDINYNFPLPTTDDSMVVSDPNDVSGLYDWSTGGVIAELAGRLVEYFGKDIPQPITKKSRFGINVIKQRTVQLNPQQYPRRMPRGSGNTRGYNYFARFYYPSYAGRADATPIIVTQNMDLTSDFTRDLVGDDEIQSYTIESDPNGGVSLVSSNLTGNVVSYRVVAEKERPGKIEIVATSVAGLILPRAYCFETKENTCVVTNA